MRDKNKRASLTPANAFSGGHTRSKSVNAAAAEPPREIIAPPPVPAPVSMKNKKPDHLGERMLRGDFMMD